MTHTTTRRASSWTATVALLGAALLSGGCSSYKVQGKVIQGEASYAAIVDRDDERLQRPGIEGASVVLTLDPDSLARKPGGSGASDADGAFSIPVDEFGAGFLEFELGVEVRRPGYRGVNERFKMPGSGKRLLVILAPGRDSSRPQEDLLEQYRRFR